MNRRSWLLWVSVLFSCGPVSDPYAPDQNEFDDVATALTCNTKDPTQNCLQLRANTFRIDDEARMAVVSSGWNAQTQTLTVELKKGVSLPAKIKVGTILYRGRKDRPPLMHRVTALSQTGQVVTATLERVSLKEAFSRGRVHTRLYLSEKTPTGQPLTSVPGVQRQPLEIALGPEDCSGTIVDGTVTSPGPPVPVSGQVTLSLTKCRFQLRAWVDLTLEWDEGIANLDKFELTVGGAVDANMHARLRAAVSGAIGKQYHLWEGPEVPITVGGILITINPSLFAGFNVSGEADLTIEHGFDMTQSLEVGFGYSDRLDWYSIDESTSNFTEFGPNVTFDGRLTATAYITPRLDVKALGLVGATVTLKTFGEATLSSTASGSGSQVHGQLCRSLDVGLTPAIGAVVEVLGVSLLNETIDLTTVRVPIVKNNCSDYTGNIPANCDPASPCCLDSQCPVTAPGTTSRCKRGAATQQGLFRFACETVYPDRYCTSDAACADMSVATTDRCDNYSCVHVMPDAPAQATLTMAPANLSLGCSAPDCCHSNSDCAEASGPRRVCVKATGATPSQTGQCRNR